MKYLPKFRENIDEINSSQNSLSSRRDCKNESGGNKSEEQEDGSDDSDETEVGSVDRQNIKPNTPKAIKIKTEQRGFWAESEKNEIIRNRHNEAAISNGGVYSSINETKNGAS